MKTIMKFYFFLRFAVLVIIGFCSPPSFGYGAELSFGDPTVYEDTRVSFPIDLKVIPGDESIVAINLEITHSANLVLHTVVPCQEIINAAKTVKSFSPSATTVRVVIFDLANNPIPEGPLINIGFTALEEVITGNGVDLHFSEAVAANDQAQNVPLTSAATISKSIDDLFSSSDPEDPDSIDDSSDEQNVDPGNGEDDSGNPSSLAKDGGGSSGCFIGFLTNNSF